MSANFNSIQFYQWNCAVLLRTLWLISVDILAIKPCEVLENCKVSFRVLNNHPPSLYGHVPFRGPPFGLSVMREIMWCPCSTHASGRQNKRVCEQILDICPMVLEFGLINDPLLFVTGRRWCRSSVTESDQMSDNWEIKAIFCYP